MKTTRQEVYIKPDRNSQKTFSVKCRPEPKLFKNRRTLKNIYFRAYLMPAGTFRTGFVFGIFNVSIFGQHCAVFFDCCGHRHIFKFSNLATLCTEMISYNIFSSKHTI